MTDGVSPVDQHVRDLGRAHRSAVEAAIERCDRAIYYLAYPQPGTWNTTDGEIVAWLVHEPEDEDRRIWDMDRTPVTWRWRDE